MTLAGAAFVTWGAIGGCVADDPAFKDDGGAQREVCTARVSACRDRCNEADLGLGCRICCESTGRSCDNNEDHSFNACLDK